MNSASPRKVAPRRVIISTGYTPRPLQAKIHAELRRFNVLVAHRRFGKTVFAINHILDDALRNNLPDPRYAYIAPLRTQAKDVAWEYLKRYTGTIPSAVPNETELRVDLPGGRRIRLYGADNPDMLRGLYFDGVVMDEPAQQEPRVWAEIIRPALVDRRGWALFIGTPMGRNEFCRLYEGATLGWLQEDTSRKLDPDWLGLMYKASQTNVIAPSELEAAKQIMSAEQFEQEFECSFEAAIVGSYYGRLIADAEQSGRLSRALYDPKLPVVTAWDLGIGDSTAIWFCQQIGNEVRLIDYEEAAGEGMSFFAKKLAERPYSYIDHICPHDADARMQDETGRTRREVLNSLGIRIRVLPKSDKADGIEAARVLLPRCYFDSGKCHRGLEALRQYRREWDEKAKTFRSYAMHDWTSHGADAFRYLAVGLKPPKAKRKVGERPNYGADGWLAA